MKWQNVYIFISSTFNDMHAERDYLIKRVVDVCLNNVDKCRPFLLSLLGQRRGWVPGLSDINEETLMSS